MHTISRGYCEELSLVLKTFNPSQISTYGKVFLEILKAWNYDVTDRTFENHFVKSDSLLVLKIRQVRRMKKVFLEEMKTTGIQLNLKQKVTDDELLEDVISLDPEAETSVSQWEKIKTKHQWIAMKTKIMKTMIMHFHMNVP
ncbi:hypothetical protein TNCV_4658561 [Trichonephila clavipes]|nr:hypothetical protein TNCV_4658561 [Trichonephila clavipes]